MQRAKSQRATVHVAQLTDRILVPEHKNHVKHAPHHGDSFFGKPRNFSLITEAL